jgi:hypothetical protein
MDRAHLSPCPEIVPPVLVEQRALHTSRAIPAASYLAAVIGPGTATSCSEDRLAAKSTDQKGFSVANAAQSRVRSPAGARARKQITLALALARTVNGDHGRGAKRSECSMNRSLCEWRARRVTACAHASRDRCSCAGEHNAEHDGRTCRCASRRRRVWRRQSKGGTTAGPCRSQQTNGVQLDDNHSQQETLSRHRSSPPHSRLLRCGAAGRRDSLSHSRCRTMATTQRRHTPPKLPTKAPNARDISARVPL